MDSIMHYDKLLNVVFMDKLLSWKKFPITILIKISPQTNLFHLPFPSQYFVISKAKKVNSESFLPLQKYHKCASSGSCSSFFSPSNHFLSSHLWSCSSLTWQSLKRNKKIMVLLSSWGKLLYKHDCRAENRSHHDVTCL